MSNTILADLKTYLATLTDPKARLMIEMAINRITKLESVTKSASDMLLTVLDWS